MQSEPAGQGASSSSIPSQLSSSPLQTSVRGPVPPMQVSIPPTQRIVPGMQVPMLSPHEVPAAGFVSSTKPLQSSSMPLQTSGPVGVQEPVQVSPSSMASSQSSSMPLQDSVPGGRPGAVI